MTGAWGAFLVEGAGLMGAWNSSSLSKKSIFLEAYLRITPLVEGALAMTAEEVPNY